MRELIEKVLNEKIKPGLQRDGGDIQLIDVTDDGVVKVKLRGACACCPGAKYTLQMGVERILKEAVPQVKKVESV
ncbi:MAG: NifU family protein [Candidatus Omnitrophica bacterium]|nr:NifU family protein [Candidatus Omnitrophota bacterium]